MALFTLFDWVKRNITSSKSINSQISFEFGHKFVDAKKSIPIMRRSLGHNRGFEADFDEALKTACEERLGRYNARPRKAG